MKTRHRENRLLWYESAGFGLILALAWLDEFTNLPYLFFGGQTHVCDWRDSATESVLIILIWATVFIATRRLLTHVRYLEDFLKVCAWCRKVGHEDKWMQIEEYFAEGLNLGTSHGVCPECLEKLKHETSQFRKAQIEAQAAKEARQAAEAVTHEKPASAANETAASNGKTV
jgi:hypothetical protein